MVQEGEDVFVPETCIQPTQLFGRRGSIPEPLTKFAFALLSTALDDLTYKSIAPYRRFSRKRAADEVRLWFLSDSRDPASFAWVCEILNIKPHMIRQRLR